MKSKKVSSETMLEWFHNKYEDAAHSVFYNGRDGGYQFEPGNEAYEPSEVLQEQFPDADLDTIKEAVAKLSDGTQWVRKCL